MAIVIDKPGLGELLGSGFGSGLSQGVQALTNQKLQQIQEQNQRMQLASGLQSALNINPEQAQAYAALPESILQPLIKQRFQQQEMNDLANILQPGQAYEDPLKGLSEVKPFNLFDSFISPRSEPQASTIADTLGIAQPKPQQPQITPTHLIKAASISPRAFQAAKSVFDTQEGERNRQARIDAARLQEEGRQSRFEASQKQTANDQAFRATQKYRERIGQEGEAAASSQLRTGRLKQLILNGSIDDPYTVAARRYLGLPNAWSSTDTRELEQLSTIATQDIKKDYGGNPSNKEIDLKLKGLPTELDTNEQKLALIKNIEFSDWIKSTRAQAMQAIIAQNNNVPPRDINERVDKYMKGVLTRVAPLYIQGEDIPSELPPAQDYEPNTVIEIEETGQRYIKDGNNWRLEV